MVKRYSSLADYLQDVHYDLFFDAAKKHIRERGYHSFSSCTFLISLCDVDLEDIHIRSVHASVTDSDFVDFVAAVEADVVLKGLGRRDYDADMKSEWVSVYFKGQLLDGLNMVTVIDVGEYRTGTFDKETTLSKYMVPYLYAEDLEKAAEDFLSRNCPRALETPMPVDIDEIRHDLFHRGRCRYLR